MYIPHRVPSALKNTELADALPRKELAQLDEVATAIDIDPGKQIIAENTTGREVFVVVDGRFDVEGAGFRGSIGAGEVAGELAILTGRRRNASVTASTDARAYAMRPRQFAALLSEAPTFREQVVQTATKRLGSPVSLPAQLLPGHEKALTAWHVRRSISRLPM